MSVEEMMRKLKRLERERVVLFERLKNTLNLLSRLLDLHNQYDVLDAIRDTERKFSSLFFKWVEVNTEINETVEEIQASLPKEETAIERIINLLKNKLGDITGLDPETVQMLVDTIKKKLMEE